MKRILGSRWIRILPGVMALAILSAEAIADRASHSYGSRDFGSDGRDGRQGDQGYHGRNGPSQTIRASGGFARYDAKGEWGGNGGHGYRGDDARSCRQPSRPAYDIQGADGGDGGKGGNGGRGGNGGHTTVYAQNLADLKKVFIDASGGEGGQYGRGGDGGQGCYCSDRSWTVRKCRTVRDPHDDDPDRTRQECTEQTYRCRDGRYGNRGRDGSRGSRGQMGNLTVINQAGALSPSHPSRSLNLDTAMARGVKLSKDLWETRSGATRLLAPGSKVQDRYRLRVRRIHQNVVIRWDSSRPPALFGSKALEFSLSDTGQVSVKFPKDVLAEFKVNQGGATTEVVIKEIIYRHELANFTFASIGDEGIVANIVDQAGVSHLVSTKLSLDYLTRSRWGWPIKRWSGLIPESWMTKSAAGFLVEAGNVPLRGGLKSGLEVTLRLRMTRTFAGVSKSVIVSSSTYLDIGAPGLKAASRIQAEWHDEQHPDLKLIPSGDKGGGQSFGYANEGEYVKYTKLDFGDGVRSLDVRLSRAKATPGAIEFRLDSVDGPILATVDPKRTGSWQTYVTLNQEVAETTGVHDVFAVFRGAGVNLNWFGFKKTIGVEANRNAKSLIPAESFDHQMGVVVGNYRRNKFINYTNQGDYIKYDNLDFGDGVDSLKVSLASAIDEQVTLKLRLNSLEGPVIATVTSANTGGWLNWETIEVSVSDVQGVQTIFGEFSGPVNVDWFQFE